MLRILQIYFVRNQKLIKTQNSPRKLLKLAQIQIKIFKFFLFIETRDCKYDYLQFHSTMWLPNVRGVFYSLILQNFFYKFLILIYKIHQ